MEVSELFKFFFHVQIFSYKWKNNLGMSNFRAMVKISLAKSPTSNWEVDHKN
jgi:hypothetical protein